MVVGAGAGVGDVGAGAVRSLGFVRRRASNKGEGHMGRVAAGLMSIAHAR